ncbi:MAG TPA: hypothetical protein VHC22_30320 [Pirellulales bacterium]|nr:hypothetical protein [Pirellulales bacterium]
MTAMRQLAFLICIFLATATAAPAAVTPRALTDERQDLSVGQDVAESQLWLVSTRRLPHGPINTSRRLLPEVSRYESSAGWRQTTHDELMAAHDRRLTTVVLVHGNDTDEPAAIAKGLELYQSLVRRSQEAFRLIVWSWPSDYVPGTLRQDARIKAERAETDSYYLAQLVSEIDSDEPVGLVGYSFGARVITGGLHLLGGGSLAGNTVESAKMSERTPVRVVLMAAALDDDWLVPGHRHGRALTVVERMVLLVNPQDRALRWYRFLVPRSGATALGAHGISSLNSLGVHRQKIEQVNVNSYVGVQHGWSSYVGSPQILEQLKREVLVGSNRGRAQPTNDAAATPDLGEEAGEEAAMRINRHGG